MAPTKMLVFFHRTGVRIRGWCSPRMGCDRNWEKLIFFLCHLYWVYVHLGAKIIVSACLWRRWHQEKCPTDRENSFWALQPITLLSLKSGCDKKVFFKISRFFFEHFTKCCILQITTAQRKVPPNSVSALVV